MIIGYTQGTFDMFHIGHLNLIKHAKEHCDYLIVGVNSDNLVEEYKNKKPVVSQDNRMAIIEEMKHVDQVVLAETLDKTIAYDTYHFDRIFIGDDWKGNPRWEATAIEMKKLGAELVWLPYTKDISSTLIKQKIKDDK